MLQYVVVRDALSDADALALHAALDDIHAVKLAEDAARPDPAHRDIPHRMAIFSPANSLGLAPPVLDLVRNTRVLPKVVDVLGWNVSLYHAHANITQGPDADGLVVDGQGRATPQLAQRPPKGQEKTFGWHQDTSRVNIEMDAHPGPRLSVKVAYFLTDLVDDSQGPTWVVPKSHKRSQLAGEYLREHHADGIGQPEGAIPILCPANSALIFDRRLYHTAAPNWSDTVRKAFFVRALPTLTYQLPRDRMSKLLPAITAAAPCLITQAAQWIW